MKWLAVVALLVACKKHDTQPPPPKRDAAPVEVDWARCEAALAKRPVTLDTLIDGCRVCGDWAPIFDWATPQAEGGPTRSAIEQAMTRCDAWCDPNAKQRFMGTLDEARGANTRAPWRYLGEWCKDKVSAVPDARYLSAPFFALDRIARAAAAHGGQAAQLASKIDLALPAVSITGAGVELPTATAGDDPPPLALTILGDNVAIGQLPRARLADRVIVDLGDPLYPGRTVARRDLLVKFDVAAAKATLLAPRQMHADTVVTLARAAAKAHIKLYLAVEVPGSQWSVPRVAPKPIDEVSKGADTVQDLATALASPR